MCSSIWLYFENEVAAIALTIIPPMATLLEYALHR
jgi:hypothetical protein